MQGTFLNIIKAIYNKPICNIKLNGEKLNAIPVKSGTRLSCSLCSSLFSIGLEVLAKAISQLKEIKWMQLEERTKSIIICGDMIVYISDP